MELTKWVTQPPHLSCRNWLFWLPGTRPSYPLINILCIMTHSVLSSYHLTTTCTLYQVLKKLLNHFPLNLTNTVCVRSIEIEIEICLDTHQPTKQAFDKPKYWVQDGDGENICQLNKFPPGVVLWYTCLVIRLCQMFLLNFSHILLRKWHSQQSSYFEYLLYNV